MKQLSYRALGWMFAGLMVGAVGLVGCEDGAGGDGAVANGSLGQVGAALTAEQCSFFADGDQVTFCHAANLKKGKYVLIRTNLSGCVNGHANHEGDFISVDGTCSNEACFPVGAPYDGTVACCDNMEVVGGACACAAGYETLDGETCTDIDECAEGTDDCDANASCTNTPGSFTCVCNAGYEGDGVTCTDIDECAEGTAGCDASATCTNTAGGFDCSCNEGYEGDGSSCTDTDGCATAPCDANASCTDAPAPATGATCTCNEGYEGDGLTCSAIPAGPYCGDGVVNQPTELCDLGSSNGVGGSGCNADCTLQANVQLSARIHEHCSPSSTSIPFDQDTATLNWPPYLNRPSYVTLGAHTGIIVYSGPNFTGQQLMLTSNTNFCGTTYPNGATVNDNVLSFQLFYLP